MVNWHEHNKYTSNKGLTDQIAASSYAFLIFSGFAFPLLLVPIFHSLYNRERELAVEKTQLQVFLFSRAAI